MGWRPSAARNKLYNWMKRVGDKGPTAQFYRGKRPIWKGMKQLYEGLWLFESATTKNQTSATVSLPPFCLYDGDTSARADNPRGSATVLTAACECYHAGMRRLPLPLLVLIILIAFPVAIPIGIASWIWDRRRMRAAAERTHCERCGATLAVASLHRADSEWTKRVAARLDARPGMRLRMIRSLWAICAACGAEFDYDFRSRIFHCIAGSGEPGVPDQGPASTRK